MSTILGGRNGRSISSQHFPNKTWKTPHPNIKAGDVCLLHKNLGKHVAASYKYCKVLQATTNQDRLVRKVVIKYYNVLSKRAKQREVDIC